MNLSSNTKSSVTEKVKKEIVQIFDLIDDKVMQMSPENFIKELYALLIAEGSETYKDLFFNTRQDEAIIEYWQRALELFSILPKDKHEVFLKLFARYRLTQLLLFWL